MLISYLLSSFPVSTLRRAGGSLLLLEFCSYILFCFFLPSADHPEVAAAIREAAREAGSSSAEEYTVKFNVDILAPNVKHADSQVSGKDRTFSREPANTLSREKMDTSLTLFIFLFLSL